MYERALDHESVHALEHFSLLATAVLFWEALCRQRHRGASVLWLFVFTLPTTAFGFAMTMARRPWYPSYATNSAVAALHDQQLAGVIMWSVGGLATLVGAVAFYASWLVNATSVREVAIDGALS
jgi:putative membrane protein